MQSFLNGGAGADILDGGSGADTMAGGQGDDVYLVDNTADVVTENANEGIDTIKYSADFNANVTLSANVENLELSGSNNLNATGNASDNRMIGNDGANTLDGGAGDDILTGGKGNDLLIGGTGGDTFIWNLADRGLQGAPAIDTIRGFDTAAYSNIEAGTTYGNPAGGTGLVTGGGDRIDLRFEMSERSFGSGVAFGLGSYTSGAAYSSGGRAANSRKRLGGRRCVIFLSSSLLQRRDRRSS